MRFRRMLVVAGLAIGLVVAAPAVAGAHPLGNFSVNRYAGLRVGSERVAIDYVVDMSEIPTVQTRPDIDTTGDEVVDPSEERAYATAECARLARGVRVAIDGERVPIRSDGGALSFPPGQAGLDTLRLECRLEAPVSTVTAARHTVAFSDANLDGRIGWREITAVGDGTVLRSDVPRRSVSNRLTKYPDDRIESPLDQENARGTFRPGGAAAPPVETSPAAPIGRGFDSLTETFTGSVANRDLTVGLALIALAVGLLLGALHAVVPGHGKTVMAAYLVGERGSMRDGLLIGLTVAATHTLGVLALGAFLAASEAFAPETLYPWLTLASGLAFAGLGLQLLVRAVRRRANGGALLGHGHHGGAFDGHHEHPHEHSHTNAHDHSHDHKRGHARSWRELATLGVAGGLVPTPSAVVILLGATAIGRAWFGVALVLAYGIGMAATLVAAGLLLAYARRRFDLRARGEQWLQRAAFLPIVTAGVVIVSGLVIVLRGVRSV